MKPFLPKKSLGQNFLVDPNIIRKIITACDLKPTDVVLEIGPGKGALTRDIAPRVEKIFAVETDPQLTRELRKQLGGTNLSVLENDFLKFDLTTLPQKLKVIGNLPYYISSAIIAKLFADRKHWASLYMTVQWEFGKRMLAAANTKDYGAFSLFVQYYARPQILFRIKKSCFSPMPKVESCFMKLQPLSEPQWKVTNENLLFQVIRQAFQQRRKQIINSLAGLCDKTCLDHALTALKIPLGSRAENLTLQNYVDITNSLAVNRSNLQTNASSKPPCDN